MPAPFLLSYPCSHQTSMRCSPNLHLALLIRNPQLSVGTEEISEFVVLIPASEIVSVFYRKESLIKASNCLRNHLELRQHAMSSYVTEYRE